MCSFDFGVSLSLCLMFVGLILCVSYGIFYWNKDSEEEGSSAKRWEKEEQKINEEM